MLNRIKRIPLAFALITVIILSQCVAAQVQTMQGFFATTSFPEDMSMFPNPERGWYRSMETDDLSETELMRFRESNITMVAFETFLGAYLTRPLDTLKLNEVDRAFAAERRAGLSVIFRAAYDFEGAQYPDPTDINIVLNHIRQLAPVFQKYEDVLFNIQAGFFGSWGEWHTSNFGEHKLWAPVSPQNQRALVNALLDAAPKNTTVAVRRPEYVRNIAGTAPLTAAEAFGTSKISRVAFHNDALMSEKTDMDTYVDPDYPLEKEFEWINNHTRYTPFIGETNKVSSYNDTKNAIPFLDLMNANSLNYEYHPNVLRKWKTSNYSGINAFDYITMMLGYRIVLKEAVLNNDLRPGGVLNLQLELANTGFGHILREKDFVIVLKKGNVTYRASIDEDARFWDKNEIISRDFSFRLPTSIPLGSWDVYLGLTSTFENLRNNPSYSVRFANQNVWEPSLGLNKIGLLTVTGTQIGPEAAEFIQIREQTAP